MRRKRNNVATQQHLLTKTEALHALGIGNSRNDKRLWPATDLVHVAQGRQLIRRRQTMRAAIAVVAGSVEVGFGSNGRLVLNSPCVIDSWCADEQMHSLIDVTASTASTLVLIAVERRDHAFAHAPRLARYSRESASRVLCALDGARQSRDRAEPVVDARVQSEEPAVVPIANR